MRAAVLYQPGEPLRVEDVELGAPRAGEVRVRVAAAGVCHSDYHYMRGDLAGNLPVVLGHEGAGVVEEVGAGVDGLEPGQRVVLGWRTPCGRCAWCLRGEPRLCRTPPRAKPHLRLPSGEQLAQTLQTGTFATRTVVHSSAAIPYPAELPPEQACLIGCSVATGVGSVLHTAHVWEGARVGVIGCGAVGLSVVQGARIAGAAEIHAVDLESVRTDLAQRFGATHVGEAERLDFVFDVVGRPETIAQGLRQLGHAGTLVVIGLPRPGSQAAVDLQELFDRRLRIVVSHGGDHWPAEDFPQLAQWALDGKLDLAGMVTRLAGLEDVEAAFADLGSGEAIRTVIQLLT
jgi:Zn-dependent alcohol dehydrogenase